MVLWNNLMAGSRIQVSIVARWVWLVVITCPCADTTSQNSSLENYGSLLVWDAAMPQLKPVMDKYKEKQRIYQ